MALPPYAVFERNLERSFVVFTGASVLLSLKHVGVALGVWIAGFLLTIGASRWAGRRTMSSGRSGILSLFLWVLVIAYTGGVVFWMR